jgi:sporulation protein YlmC with PRC-barrel domain
MSFMASAMKLRYTICNMLQLSGNLLNQPVLSLQTGGVIATTTKAIINPNNLKIEGFYCIDAFDRKQTFILVEQDIRDVIAQGLVVNDHDSLSDPKELVRLKDTLGAGFELTGKQVMTTEKQKVGKVVDYAADTESMYIQKLYVGQSILKSFTGGSLSVDRSQIVEIHDRKIIIHDIMPGVPAKFPAAA